MGMGLEPVVGVVADAVVRSSQASRTRSCDERARVNILGYLVVGCPETAEEQQGNILREPLDNEWT